MKIKYLFWWCFVSSASLTFIGAEMKLNGYTSTSHNTLLGALFNFAVATICGIYIIASNRRRLTKAK